MEYRVEHDSMGEVKVPCDITDFLFYCHSLSPLCAIFYEIESKLLLKAKKVSIYGLSLKKSSYICKQQKIKN